jgi:hypothetical protein
VHGTRRQVQHIAGERWKSNVLGSEAPQPDPVAPDEVIERVVDGSEESAAIAFALLIGKLLAGRVQPLVEPAVVAGQETVVFQEGAVFHAPHCAAEDFVMPAARACPAGLDPKYIHCRAGSYAASP